MDKGIVQRRLSLRGAMFIAGLGGEKIYLTVKPASQAVQAAMDWFMGDSPHRKNILNQHFNRLGVGVAQEPAGWYTFVLVFAGD